MLYHGQTDFVTLV